MSEPKLDEATLKSAAAWDAIACMHGYNEMAKLAKTLGEKVYCRMACDAACKMATDLGAEIHRTETGGEVLFTISEVSPSVKFRAEDIEGMRAAVLAFDGPWEDAADQWSEAIHAAHPTRSESHDEWGQAMEMVGHRHSKGELVALVNWLLLQVKRRGEAVVGNQCSKYKTLAEHDGCPACFEFRERDRKSLRDRVAPGACEACAKTMRHAVKYLDGTDCSIHPGIEGLIRQALLAERERVARGSGP
jgi:hypothetical protein